MDLTGIKRPACNYPLQGISLAKTITKKTPVKRKYIVSENWSQASVITKDYKLGIMLDPTVAASKRDYRSFGNMFFERKTDPTEVKNQINSVELIPVIEKLKGYYADFEKTVSGEGRLEMIENAKSAVKVTRK
jgi:hypothetical protein